MSSDRPRLSVVVLLYQSEPIVERCLSSLLEADGIDEIIVVDNASSDRSYALAARFAAERPELISLVQNAQNLGFAEGNNIGAGLASGDVLLFLNDDAFLTPTAPVAIKRAFLDPRVGALQCNLRDDEPPHASNSNGISLGRLGGIHWNADDPAHPLVPVFAVLGAAIAVRAEIFRDVGGFDRRFFLLFEETDLCWRLRLRGYDVVVARDAVAYHESRSRYIATGRHGYLLFRNRIRSLLKNMSGPRLAWVLPLHLAGLAAYSLWCRVRRDRARGPGAMGRAILWNLRVLGDTWTLRRSVQRTRRVSDRALFRAWNPSPALEGPSGPVASRA